MRYKLKSIIICWAVEQIGFSLIAKCVRVHYNQSILWKSIWSVFIQRTITALGWTDLTILFVCLRNWDNLLCCLFARFPRDECTYIGITTGLLRYPSCKYIWSKHRDTMGGQWTDRLMIVYFKENIKEFMHYLIRNEN